jgi:hypothetical protein
MRENKTIEVKVCDACGKSENVFHTCLRCGKDFCYDDFKKEGVEYKHAVFFGGSDDVEFCKACDIELHNNRNEPLYGLHKAFLNIKWLVAERKGYDDEFDKRTKEAEERVQYFLKKEKGK